MALSRPERVTADAYMLWLGRVLRLGLAVALPSTSPDSVGGGGAGVGNIQSLNISLVSVSPDAIAGSNLEISTHMSSIKITLRAGHSRKSLQSEAFVILRKVSARFLVRLYEIDL